jgi:putative ABC transport system permease protein
MSSLWQDIRYALRMMAKTPGLTAVLAITLAVGIGASTTIFSVVNSVVLKPLPYAQPGRMVRIYTEFLGNLNLHKFWMSPPEFDDIRRECRSCESIAAWHDSTVSLGGGDHPVRVDAAYATHELLPLLGVKPMLGRYFDASEDMPGDPTVVIIGYDVWKRAFAGDPAIVGRTILLDARSVTVVGVMPQGFDFFGGAEAWVPFCLDFAKANRGSHFLNIVARLKPDASIQNMRDEFGSMTAAWGKAAGANSHALSPDKHPLIVLPFQDDLVGSLASTLWLLQGAVLFVLLISIVNIANLLLARSESRTREVAVRHALGATHRRLVRQFITESLVLAVLGAGLGVLVSAWALDGVTALIPKSAPRIHEISLDVTAVLFAVGCAVAAALLFGLAPILHARKTDIYGSLKDGSNRMTGTPTRLRVRRALVIGEVALAVVLVVGCTVMVRSFMRLQRVDIGMDPDHLLTFEVQIPKKTYPNLEAQVFFDRLEKRMRALPGVTHATLIEELPPERDVNANDLNIPGRTPKPGDPPFNVDYWNALGDDAIATLGAHLVRGRELTASDTLDAPPVAIVNEAFAARFFPGEDAIGKRVQLSGGPDTDPIQTIVGIVADIKQNGVDHPAGSEAFVHWRQFPHVNDGKMLHSLVGVLRTDGDPRELTGSVYRLMSELDPTVPLSKVRPMEYMVWSAVAKPRFLTFLLSCFAGVALLLAAVGIYGVMAHTVAQRTHEIGLRVALGAHPAQVRSLVLRQAATLVGAGVVIGLAAAVGLQVVLDNTLQSLFYGASLSQPVLLGGVALAVTASALVATWIPARRATRIQPSVALRSE